MSKQASQKSQNKSKGFRSAKRGKRLRQLGKDVHCRCWHPTRLCSPCCEAEDAKGFLLSDQEEEEVQVVADTLLETQRLQKETSAVEWVDVDFFDESMKTAQANVVQAMEVMATLYHEGQDERREALSLNEDYAIQIRRLEARTRNGLDYIRLLEDKLQDNGLALPHYPRDWPELSEL